MWVREMNWLRRVFSSDEAKADLAVESARENVDKVEVSIRAEMDTLEREFALHKGLLANMVQSNEPKQKIMQQTRRVNSLQKQLSLKTNLLGNMHRERQQLASANTNTKVAKAMQQSVEAQKQLMRVNCDGEDVDELLDEVEDHRAETVDLAERLGAMGDEEDDIYDAEFTPDDVVGALGWQTEESEGLFVEKIKTKMGMKVEGDILASGGEADGLQHFPNVPQSEPTAKMLSEATFEAGRRGEAGMRQRHGNSSWQF